MRSALLSLGLVLATLAGTPVGAAPDDAPPSVAFGTQDGAILLGLPTGHETLDEVPADDAPAAGVHGTARDVGSGVDRVMVTFCRGSRRSDGGWTCGSNGVALPGDIVAVDAALRCRDQRRSCSWAVAAPALPGTYLVVARAWDRAGNARSRGPIEVVVA
jgi:hypothetical protein